MYVLKQNHVSVLMFVASQLATAGSVIALGRSLEADMKATQGQREMT